MGIADDALLDPPRNAPAERDHILVTPNRHLGPDQTLVTFAPTTSRVLGHVLRPRPLHGCERAWSGDGPRVRARPGALEVLYRRPDAWLETIKGRSTPLETTVLVEPGRRLSTHANDIGGAWDGQ